MSFAEIPEGGNKSNFKSTDFVKIVPGIPVRLRILDKKAVHQVRHYLQIQKLSLLCLGDERCPICQNNSNLMKENPTEDAFRIKGFIPRQNRYLVNVLNRTIVKIAPSGSVVYPTSGQFPTVDPSTGEPLANIEAAPLNKVQVLDRGPDLFSQFNMVNEQVVDEMGKPIGIWNFDISIMATGAGKKMKTNVQALSQINDVVEVADEDKYVLETMGILLEPDEMSKILKGIPLKDIFAARRSDDEVASEAPASTAIQDTIEALFGA